MSRLANDTRIAAELRAQLIDAGGVESSDSDTLHDMIEGQTSLLEIITSIAQSAVTDEAYAGALGDMIANMHDRKKRFLARAERRRAAILWAMQEAGLTKHDAPALSLSIRAGHPSVVITDADALPAELVRIKYEPDKIAIGKALRDGPVTGAHIANASPSLAIRTK